MYSLRILATADLMQGKLSKIGIWEVVFIPLSPD